MTDGSDERGFPAGTKSLPVPAPLLSSLLAEIDDPAELRCTLRFLWHMAQARSVPRAVAAEVLETDDVLARAVGSPETIREAVASALARGTLLQVGDRLLLNTPENRAGASRQAPASAGPAREAPAREQTNVFALYEANIGMLTPMVAEQLRDAEQEYPAEWIADAIREATERNARSWRYIATVLERWQAEGRGSREARDERKHGKPGRHPEALSAAEYVRRYGLRRP